MTDRNKSSTPDQDLVEAIKEIAFENEGDGHDADSLYSFCNLLVSSPPTANEIFQRQLEDRLVSNLVERRQEVQRVDVQQRNLGLFGWLLPSRPRLRMALSALLLTVLLTTLLLIPDTREALATFFGFSIDEPENLDRLVVEVAQGSLVVGDERLPEMDTGYEVQIVEVPDSRWDLYQARRGAGFSIPQSDGDIALDGDRIIPVPAVLPKGFEWQGVVVPNSSTVHQRGIASFGSTRGGGGGTTPLPAFDRSFAAYLIGGDPADHLLLLAQFDPSTLGGLAVRAFQITAPPEIPPSGPGASRADDSTTEIAPTPTPVPSFYEGKAQLGYIVQQGTEEQEDLIVVARGAQEIVVNGTTGFWYQGTWAPDGNWVGDSDITTLTWKQSGYVYQLSGQGLSLDELVAVAASIE